MKWFCVIAIWSLLASALLVPVGPRALSPIERQILKYVDAHAEEAIAFLQKIVNINSGTMNHPGVGEVGRVFQAELDALGFETRWIPMDSVNRAGHLFGERRGQRGKRLLLIGHLDTVFEKESRFQYFEPDGSAAKGPGVEDMKGGDVVILYALKALDAVGALEDASITIALTGDEEDTGDPLSISRRDLLEAARRSDVALGFEGGVGDITTATVARRGFTGWKLQVTATPGHSSQIFKKEFGSGAIYEAARILNAFYEELRGEEYLTFSPGIILGGTTVEYDAAQSRGTAFGKTNVIPETAVVAGDLRFISDEQRERTKERMRAIVAQNLANTSAEITFEDSSPAMSPTPGNNALLAQLDQVSQDLGYGPVRAVDPGDRGAADISFVARFLDAIDGLGVVGSGAHTVQETVDLTSLPKMTKRAAILMYRLTK
ncbi:M20/M25/M40 family metallo-hydrolase [Acidobacteria bacterium AH-259-O06]|nr:M20/M25/M40 family metallo-hydrolase [Acidobacteria bacterium AH-259-O06]